MSARSRSSISSRLAVLGAIAAVVAACAADATPDLTVSDAQAAVPAAGSAQVVLEVANTGDGDDALLAIETDAAIGIELHETRIEDGQATMVELDEVPIPAGETVRFRPGGLHLMMVGPGDEVVLGAEFPITLVFDRSGEVTTTAQVRDLLDLHDDAVDDATGGEAHGDG